MSQGIDERMMCRNVRSTDGVDDGVDGWMTIKDWNFILKRFLASFHHHRRPHHHHHRLVSALVMDPSSQPSTSFSSLHSSSSHAGPSAYIETQEIQSAPCSRPSLKESVDGPANANDEHKEEIRYRPYGGEHDIEHVMRLVETELSEPYTIYTYRYFLHQWPNLAYFAYSSLNPDLPIGIVVCKQEMHRMKRERGYIAMLSVDKQYRKRKIASRLVEIAIEVMTANGSEEIALETEFDNLGALALYSSMGFMKEKRLFRFYLNGKDAHRLILPILNPCRPAITQPFNMFSANPYPPPPQHPSRTSKGVDSPLSSPSSPRSSIRHSPWPEEESGGANDYNGRKHSEEEMEPPNFIPASFGIV